MLMFFKRKKFADAEFGCTYLTLGFRNFCVIIKVTFFILKFAVFTKFKR